MRIDAEAVFRPVVLGLLLLTPVGAGVVIHHLVPRQWTEPWFFWAWVVTILVLWIYGLIEARSKHGWGEVALVLLALPFAYGSAFFTILAPRIVYEFDRITWSFPVVFLSWLAAQSLLSAHWFGRRVYTACAMSLVVTAFVTSHWYGDNLYWILHRYFMWD